MLPLLQVEPGMSTRLFVFDNIMAVVMAMPLPPASLPEDHVNIRVALSLKSGIVFRVYICSPCLLSIQQERRAP